MNKPKIYEELEEMLSDKVSKDGDTIKFLRLPIGQLFSEETSELLGLALEGAKGSEESGFGAMLALRHAESEINPGGIDILTRNPDGTFGVCGSFSRDGTFLWGNTPVALVTRAVYGGIDTLVFSNGVKIQWGTMDPHVSTVTFPIPFSIGCQVFVNPAWESVDNGTHTMIGFLSGMVGTNRAYPESFTRIGDGNALAVPMRWIAIGE